MEQQTLFEKGPRHVFGNFVFTVFLTGCPAFPPAESAPPEPSLQPPFQSESSTVNNAMKTVLQEYHDDW